MTHGHLYLDIPTPIFAARLNMPGAISYPISQLIFDTVTTGAYTDIQADLTFVLGTTAGGDDLGRGRVQNIATATTLPIMRTSQGVEDGELTIVDNAYLTIWDDYRPWSKIPYIDPATGQQFKDTNVPVGDYTSAPPPIANCGPGFADFIDAATNVITVAFDAANSVTVADGATIDTYAWDVDDGTITVGTSASSSITATFPAGKRWVSLTVVDSNGNPHTARCRVIAVDPANDVTISVFDAETTMSRDGQEVRFTIGQPIPRNTYPDGTLVMYWLGAPATPADRSHMKFIGWEQSNRGSTRSVPRRGFLTGTTLNCVDMAGKLKTLPGFPQSLERAASVTNWDKMPAPTMDKYLHYLLQWHSTALSLADYTPSGTGDGYPFVLFASEGESLFDQVESDASGLMPTYHLTCDRQGRLAVVVDPQLQDPAARTSTVQAAFVEANIAELTVEYTRVPRAHWLRKHALLTATDYTEVNGVDTLLTVHCLAPGESPGQGVDARETNEGLTPSQAVLNATTGHEYARINSRLRANVTPADPLSFLNVTPADLTWVTLTLSATYAAQRGLTFSAARCLVESVRESVQARRTGTVVTSQFVLEPETSGNPAVTVIPEGETSNPWAPTPPSLGLITDQEKVAAISSDGMLYTTSDFQTVSGSGGPTWAETDLSITDTKLFSFVVDPFSPGYINMDGTGAINAWVVGETNIWRVSDMFGSPSASIVHTFSTAISASSVFVSRTINASFGRYFAADADNPWLICVSHYADASGHTGTWATYSVDGGGTWASEVQITEHYDSDLAGNDPANIPALWMSPRTPGYAISAAYTETANPAESDAYVTRDWGQTWNRLSTGGDSDAEPLPIWFVCDDGASNGTATPLGASAAQSLNITVANDSSNRHLMCAPPANAVRVVVRCDWERELTRSSGSGSAAQTLNRHTPTGVTRSGTDDLTGATYNAGAVSGSWSYEYTLDVPSGDWVFNRTTAGASPPPPLNGIRFQSILSANASATARQDITLTVTEIELDGGYIYTPGALAPGAIVPVNRLLGDLHIPFEDNLTETVAYYGAVTRGASIGYALKRVEADGVTVTDVSPDVSGRDYGLNGYGFSVRAYDSDRQKVLVAGRGNGSTTDTDDDYVGVWVSSNAGTAWTNIVTAANSTAEYRAAFGGDDSDIIYLWGPAEYMGYSSNFGTSIDSRAGNLSSFSPANTIGIAGGPIS